MSDLIDDANDTADLFQKAALSNHLRRARVIPKGDGRCLNCGGAVTGDRRWCGAECRDVWEDERG